MAHWCVVVLVCACSLWGVQGSQSVGAQDKATNVFAAVEGRVELDDNRRGQLENVQKLDTNVVKFVLAQKLDGLVEALQQDNAVLFSIQQYFLQTEFLDKLSDLDHEKASAVVKDFWRRLQATACECRKDDTCVEGVANSVLEESLGSDIVAGFCAIYAKASVTEVENVNQGDNAGAVAKKDDTAKQTQPEQAGDEKGEPDCLTALAKGEDSSCPIFGIAVTSTKGSEQSLELLGHTFQARPIVRAGRPIGIQANGAESSSDALTLPTDFAERVANRLQAQALGVEQSCFLKSMIENQIATTKMSGLSLTVKGKGAKLEVRMGFKWKLKRSFFEENFLGGVLSWTTQDDKALGTDDDVGSATCEIIGTSASLTSANVQLSIRLENAVASTPIMQIKGLLVDVSKPTRSKSKVVTGYVDVAASVCPSVLHDSTVRTTFQQRIPVVMLPQSGQCRLRFEKKFVAKEKATGKNEIQDIEPRFCTPELTDDSHHICFVVSALTISPRYDDTDVVCSMDVREARFQPTADWLIAEPMAGALFVKSFQPGDVPTVYFRPRPRHFNQSGAGRLKFNFVVRTEKHIATFKCQDKCVGGQFRMDTDFGVLRATRDETLNSLPTQSEFLYSATEALIAPFSGRQSSTSGSSAPRDTVIQFCTPTLSASIQSAQSCDSSFSDDCFFNSGAPQIVSFANSKIALGEFGLLVSSIQISHHEDENGREQTRVTLPLTIALPENLNDILGMGILPDTYVPPKLFKTMTSSRPSGKNGAKPGEVAEYIKRHGFDMVVEALFDKASGSQRVSVKLLSVPLNKDEFVKHLDSSIIPDIPIPEITLEHQEDYYFLQMLADIPVLCPPAHDDAICTMRLPSLQFLRELFTKAGVPGVAKSIPPQPISVGRVPPLKDAITNIFGSSPRDTMMETQQAGYEAVGQFASDIKASFDRSKQDLKALNLAFKEKINDLTRAVGAHSFVPAAGAHSPVCEIPKGQDEPVCSGSFKCKDNFCDLAIDDCRKKLRSFVADSVKLGADLNAIQINKFEATTSGNPEIAFVLVVSRATLPKRLKTYFSPNQVPQSFPRSLQLQIVLNQDGNMWVWARPKNTVKTNEVAAFKTLFLPSRDDELTQGIRGITIRGLMAGYFMHSSHDDAKEAVLSVGADLDLDFFDRNKHSLEMVLQKRFSDTQCESNFDVPEEKLPHPLSLASTVRLEGAMFFVVKGKPIPVFANRAGVSMHTPLGAVVDMHLQSPFGGKEFKWEDASATLVTPSALRLPKWMGAYCFTPTLNWPLMCPEEYDVPDAGEEKEVLASRVFDASKYFESFKTQPNLDPLDLRRIFDSSTTFVSEPRKFSLQVLAGLEASHAFITFDTLKSSLVTSSIAKLPTYPGSSDSAFDQWREAIMPDMSGNSLSYLHWLVRAVEGDINNKDNLFPDFERDTAAGPNTTAGGLLNLQPKAHAHNQHQHQQKQGRLRHAAKHLQPRQHNLQPPHSSALLQAGQHHSLERTSPHGNGNHTAFSHGSRPPHHSVHAFGRRRVEQAVHHKHSSEGTGEPIGFSFLDVTAESEIGGEGLVALAFNKLMSLGTVNFGIKGIAILRLSELMSGPTKVHHIIEIGAGVSNKVPDCQSAQNERDFCFSAVSVSNLGPSSRLKEDLYLPSGLSSVIQLPVRNVCTQPRMMTPHKRRTLLRTAMDGVAFFLGEEADATLVATDNSVVLMAILKQVEATSDEQRRRCVVGEGQMYNYATCDCLHKQSQQLDITCPLTSVFVQLTRVDVSLANDPTYKSTEWKVDATVRNVPSNLLERFMTKMGLPKKQQTTVLEIVRRRTIGSLRVGDILLSDLEASPGRVVVEVCWEVGGRCIRGQSWSSLFVVPTPLAWQAVGTPKKAEIGNQDSLQVEKYAQKVQASAVTEVDAAQGKK